MCVCVGGWISFFLFSFLSLCFYIHKAVGILGSFGSEATEGLNIPARSAVFVRARLAYIVRGTVVAKRKKGYK